MRSPCLLLPCLAAAIIASCSSPRNVSSGAVRGPSNEVTDITRQRLTVPPGERSLQALRRLETLGDGGNAEAAWLRAHYLLDLFDAARFGQSAESLALLSEIAGRPMSSMKGPAATQAVAELLVLESDRILELDRKHRLGQTLRVLAGYDAAGPSERSQVSQAMQELKRIRHRGGPLAASATLRLFGYCRSALVDAQEFDRPGQRIAISHCLYPLFEADPAPYFADSPELRPPPPQLDRILERQETLLAEASPGRLAGAFSSQAAWIESYRKSSPLITPIDPLALRLAPANHAQPFDDYPVLTPGATDVARLKAEVVADGRHRVAVALAAEAPASTLLASASDLAEADIDALLVLVATRQRLRVPPGDYWSAEVGDVQVWRTGQIPLSLAKLNSTSTKVRDRASEAKATAWSQRLANLSLHLLVAPDRWTLVSPLGTLARIRVDDSEKSPEVALKESLRNVRKAFSDEQGLVLVPVSGTSLGALVLAAEAAQFDPEGLPLFPKLALAAKGPKVRSGKALEAQIRRRAAASVRVNPPALTPKIPSALRCYQALADKRTIKSGEVRLELTATGNVRPSGGSKALQKCAIDAFAEAMRQQALSAVTASFNAKAK